MNATVDIQRAINKSFLLNHSFPPQSTHTPSSLRHAASLLSFNLHLAALSHLFYLKSPPSLVTVLALSDVKPGGNGSERDPSIVVLLIRPE